ncbi:hypothetical protein JM93_01221 [Roseibium hamelinense]|uniref:DUF2065 domain-containing protein n=1 Tax=Roseibium hamelinense TaxID=150831 RepID=A0A562T9K8_9HYPH|nr:DUF2065 domain-containing protein [Roseibium hamelinense]MTI45387.1 DUF2065 domain-containing protein [Roseibium hamelinense]TWI90242.1 hypothetical protein JM93_01221 [Roseibium hamelinense]
MNDLITGIGLVLAIEGTLYAVAPGGAKSMMRSALETPDGVLRGAGLVALAIGVLVVWFVRG